METLLIIVVMLHVVGGFARLIWKLEFQGRKKDSSKAIGKQNNDISPKL